MSEKPLAFDLFVGLGGWTAGLLAEGWRVIGVDWIDMFRELGEPYPEGDFSMLVQDVRALRGSQLAGAGLIVSSSPCQKYSWMAMPWTKAKAEAARIRADDTGEELRKLNELFDTQFRLQREASESAGHHVAMVTENVRGAIPWVGRSRWNFGSYHLWGDVPALMPSIKSGRMKSPVSCSPRNWSERVVDADDPGAHALHYPVKLPGFRFDGSGRSFQSEAVKGAGGGSWFYDNKGNQRNTSSNFPARKAASARIAKIPEPLARWIARAWKPDGLT